MLCLIPKVGKGTIAVMGSLKVADHLALILAGVCAQYFPADHKIIRIGQLPYIAPTSMPNGLS